MVLLVSIEVRSMTGGMFPNLNIALAQTLLLDLTVANYR